eukprot:CAMPEP_0183711600 /NCGR_PEP_ID=MMETSP0737-20130205/7082_1 /TAXON_ID=385413 /ORGANISM="Thalassiosira miniscula, Strain CCMP1093" /LENGTH=48 /DNA_ID= /DNA_START= /DNA_END= /DNA_ORIENTATION=
MTSSIIVCTFQTGSWAGSNGEEMEDQMAEDKGQRDVCRNSEREQGSQD